MDIYLATLQLSKYPPLLMTLTWIITPKIVYFSQYTKKWSEIKLLSHNLVSSATQRGYIVLPIYSHTSQLVHVKSTIHLCVLTCSFFFLQGCNSEDSQTSWFQGEVYRAVITYKLDNVWNVQVDPCYCSVDFVNIGVALRYLKKKGCQSFPECWKYRAIEWRWFIFWRNYH